MDMGRQHRKNGGQQMDEKIDGMATMDRQTEKRVTEKEMERRHRRQSRKIMVKNSAVSSKMEDAERGLQPAEADSAYVNKTQIN